MGAPRRLRHEWTSVDQWAQEPGTADPKHRWVYRLQIVCISRSSSKFPSSRVGPSHQIQPYHSLTMHCIFPFMLSLALLANATYIPSLTKVNAADITTRDENESRSVAYFVNWV